MHIYLGFEDRNTRDDVFETVVAESETSKYSECANNAITVHNYIIQNSCILINGVRDMYVK